MESESELRVMWHRSPLHTAKRDLCFNPSPQWTVEQLSGNWAASTTKPPLPLYIEKC